jgi:hypothetical protein
MSTKPRARKNNKPNPREGDPPRVPTRPALPLVSVAETKAKQIEP